MQSGANINNSTFSSLPTEITLKIFSYLNEQTISQIAKTNKKHFSYSKCSYLYYKKIIKLGVKKKYLSSISPHIEDMRSLYHTIELIPRKERSDLTAWALSCLSGEEHAIRYAKEHLHLHSDRQDNNLRTPLHFLCLTPTTQKLINGMQLLNIQPRHLKKMDDKERNMMHYCALSGNPETLSYAILLHFNLEETDKYGADARHYAALSGSRKQIKFTLFTHRLDAHKTDLFKNASVQYALLSPNAFFATTQIKRYQQKLQSQVEPLMTPSLNG